ncbi:hypothetical protein [Neolewinella persica]|uniref:hypothetical protein n=1 Tax=Neolewinella persica TaxID=70998 RepID=UPI0003712926|nr:hypothetical protein [Neolewinella persica]
MTKVLYAFLLAGMLISCNAPAGSDEKEPESTEAAAAVTDPEPAAETTPLVPIDSDEALIATALMAAPEARRGGVKVIGYNMAGEFVTLREGTNEFICLANDPKSDRFSAACYHKSLEPFMARGRELKAEGKKAKEIFDIREEEAKSGKLSMGDPGSTLHIYYGPKSDYNPETGKVDGAIYRYVVYLPFATAESTGLPESPIAPNHPWIMNPGTHRAHIMVSPINEETE